MIWILLTVVSSKCLQNSPYSIEVMWKTFDYTKFFFFPLTAVYTVSIIPSRSRVGAYKKHMILGTYFVWGVFWFTGLSLESQCTLGNRCDLVGPKTPRMLMGLGYLSVVVADTIFAALSVVELIDLRKMEVTGMGIVRTFLANRMFRVFVLNLVNMIFYILNSAQVGSDPNITIAGQYFYRLLDSYGNGMLTLYFVEYLVAKIEFNKGFAPSAHDTSSPANTNMKGTRLEANRGPKATAAVTGLNDNTIGLRTNGNQGP
ncbi:hypothetical protein HDU85_001316 [Gaertneriomyces sp. JEL0708]|nr:hypothetical protein HDU85_001316 [Gaertneriomyces sp. JEL0708]